MPASSLVAPKRLGKEKTTEKTEINTVQMNVHQLHLEEAVGVMSQEIGTIKELLKMLFIPQAPATTKGDNAVEERRTE